MNAAATDTTAIRAALPGGAWTDAALVRQVHVRAVSADDELFLLDIGDTCPAARATALLERCMLDDEVLVGSLTVGDREALLLQLRRATLGDELDCLLRCPDASCAEELELRFLIDRVLVPPYADVRQRYSTQFTIDGHEYIVDFRPACAADLDAAAAAVGAGDPQGGAAALLHLCVTRVSVDTGEVDVDGLDPRAVARIADDMAARDPQAEIQLDARCPACGHRFDVLFDAGSYLLDELQARAHRLLADVHLLAMHYHWSEHDILAMAPSRRDRYLDLLAAEFAGWDT